MSLLSVWLAVASLIMALTMLIRRTAFTDGLIVATLYSGIIAGTLAGLVLWGTRRQRGEFVLARRQAKVAVTLAVPAAVIVYLLVAFARRGSLP